MKRQLVALIGNSGLMIVVLGLLVGPVVLGQMLGSSDKGTLGAVDVRVPNQASSETSIQASASAAQKLDYAIYPNTADFGDYASFGTSEVSAHMYQTSVTFTQFAGQQASYNGLMAVFNTSKRTLSVSVEGGTISGTMDHTRAWLSLVPEGVSAVTLVTDEAKAGATMLTVADASALSGNEVVVGTDVHGASKKSPTSLGLISPLAKGVAVGEKVYMGPVFYLNASSPLLAGTQTVTINPGQKAVVNLTVATDAGKTAQMQAVLPVVVRVD